MTLPPRWSWHVMTDRRPHRGNAAWLLALDANSLTRLLGHPPRACQPTGTPRWPYDSPATAAIHVGPPCPSLGPRAVRMTTPQGGAMRVPIVNWRQRGWAPAEPGEHVEPRGSFGARRPLAICSQPMSTATRNAFRSHHSVATGRCRRWLRPRPATGRGAHPSRGPAGKSSVSSSSSTARLRNIRLGPRGNQLVDNDQPAHRSVGDRWPPLRCCECRPPRTRRRDGPGHGGPARAAGRREWESQQSGRACCLVSMW